MKSNAATELESILAMVFQQEEYRKSGITADTFNSLSKLEEDLKGKHYDPAILRDYHSQIEQVKILIIDALIEVIKILDDDGGSQYRDAVLLNISEVRKAFNRHELEEVIQKTRSNLLVLGLGEKNKGS